VYVVRANALTQITFDDFEWYQKFPAICGLFLGGVGGHMIVRAFESPGEYFLHILSN